MTYISGGEPRTGACWGRPPSSDGGIAPRKSPFSIRLRTAERDALETMARKYTSPYRDVLRARIVLYAAQGLSNDQIAARLDTPRQIVSKWRKRFFEQRLAGLEERPRQGRPGRFPPPRRGRDQGSGL